MSLSRSKGRTRTREAESFEGRIAELGDELKQAISWNRPSILFAVYSSPSVLAKAQTALLRLVSSLEQKVAFYQVGDEDHTDIPVKLSAKRNRKQTVYFVEGLTAGGPAALRALNIRREYLVDRQIRAVFWLTEQEEGEIARSAPDFWAFRHRTVYFTDES